MTAPPALCRDCLTWHDHLPGPRCPACRSPRLLSHPELGELSISHLDCDAFYASVEKRDDPSLADLPVIVGGGRRGVVTTCCYIARIHGVRSAMPMFKARALCPNAVVIRPRMEAYVAVSRRIRTLMEALTPLVEPLSLDEAFLDLSGTARLLGAPPALTMARLARRIEDEIGLTVSVGLSHNKFLAKLASDEDKPRGFTVIGRAETLARLAPLPVGRLWGVGAGLEGRLRADGLETIGAIAATAPERLVARHGATGARLWELANGRDPRRIEADREARSISAETTFETDTSARDILEGHLWRLALRTSDRAKAKQIAGRTVVLKLKTAGFRTLTRRTTLECPTNLADTIYRTGAALLSGSLARGPFRLIGVGIGDLGRAPIGADDGSPGQGLFGNTGPDRARAEAVTDKIRARFGADTIFRGRALR